jgi:hypothetical protein
VRALKRGQQQASVERGIIWLCGDAMNRDDVLRAARGCGVIVHAVNPPGYRNWGSLVLPMIDNTIAAAIAAGATIVLPGTVYNYGPDAFPLLREDSPQHPRTRKGTICGRSRSGWKARGCVMHLARNPIRRWSKRSRQRCGDRAACRVDPSRHAAAHPAVQK